MDGSDDYFNDSFELNDDVIQILQEAETRTQAKPPPAPKTRSASPPPPKRQKVSYRESSPGDEAPEIVVRADGSYNVLGRNGVSPVEVLRNVPTLVQPVRTSAVTSKPTTTTPSTTTTTKERVQSAPLGIRPSHNLQARTVPNGSVNGASTHQLSPVDDGKVDEMQAEIAKLRQQVEQLNRTHAETEVALRKATDAQYAREGEVKILRQLAVKTSDEHAAEIAKLNATKAAAEAKQAQMEKDQRAALEKLRTQLTFQQLDSQASARKPPGSPRSRTPRHVQMQSPLPLPSNMRAWNTTATGSQGLTSTPLKARTNVAERSRSPSKRVTGNLAPKFSFPGFENSFMQRTPVKSPTSKARRPSGLGADAGFEGTPRRQSQAGPSRARSEVLSPSKRSPSKRDAPVGRLPPRDDFIQDFEMDAPHSTPPRPHRSSSPPTDFGDMSSVIGSDIIEMAVDSDKDEMDDENYEGLDFREEFHRVLLSHVPRPGKVVTFQILLSTNVPEEEEKGSKYQTCCSDILHALGDRFKFGSLEDLMATVASALVEMAEILFASEILRSLQSLMELLHSIVVYLPMFGTSLLEDHQEEEGPPPKLLNLACRILKSSPDSSKQAAGSSYEADQENLCHSVIRFLTDLVWVLPESEALKLSVLPRTDNLFTTVLDEKRSQETIAKTTKLLTVCGSHVPLTKYFLALPDIDVHATDDRPRDIKRLPLIERLNALVASGSTISPLDADIVRSIMDFYSLLIVNNPDGRRVLLKSSTIVPSIVRYLYDLTAQLFEDDERLLKSVDAASRTVSMATHALGLLHLLVLPTPPNVSPTQSQQALVEPPYDLRYALYHAPHVHFNGVAHMFIVMIGRLSCADSPEWLEPSLQAKVEQLTEPARDLMGLVIEGPEAETIWTTYQGEGEDDEETQTNDP